MVRIDLFLFFVVDGCLQIINYFVKCGIGLLKNIVVKPGTTKDDIRQYRITKQKNDKINYPTHKGACQNRKQLYGYYKKLL